MVIGHDNCREMVLEAGLEATRVITTPDYGDLVLRPPEITFSDRMTLHLRDRAVELLHVGVPAHTTNDVLVWLPEHQGAVQPATSGSTAGSPSCWKVPFAGFRSAIEQMRELAPDVLVPGHGPVCRGDDVEALLSPGMDDYLAYVEHVAAESHAAGLTPLEAAQKHRDNAYSPAGRRPNGSSATSTRAYAEIDDPGTWTPLTVPDVWPDMVAFHGGPIECHAERSGRVDARATSSGVNSTCWCPCSGLAASSSSSSAAVRPSSLAGLAHRGQRDGGGGGELDVVVADDREVAGHADARRRCAAGAGRARAGRWRRRPRSGGAAAAMPGEPLAGLAALGDGRAPSVVEHDQVVAGQAGGRPGLRGRPRGGRGPGRACSGPPTKATRRVAAVEEVLDGQPAAEHVVDGDRAEATRSSRVRSTMHDRGAAARDLVERGGRRGRPG